MKIKLQRTSPNYRQKLSTQSIMRDLTIGIVVIAVYAIISQFLSGGMNYAVKALSIFAVSIAVALAVEAVWAHIHKTNILSHIKTSFPLVTAIIFALTLPVGTPLYVVAVGSFFAIFLGKLVYGGFGQNIFNPALVGRVVVHLAFGGVLTTTVGTDVASSATPATLLSSQNWMISEAFTKVYNPLQLFLGNHGGALGETCILIILLVGIFLAYRKVLDARIPVAYLGTVALLAAVFGLAAGVNPLTNIVTHLCIGGVVFGAVIMATDPVTSPTSPLGKIIFGIGLGFLTMVIRFKANFPEGVLFSILIMNTLTPLIDSLILGRTNQKQTKQWVVVGLCLALASGLVFGAGAGIKADVEEAERKAEEERLKAEEEAKKKAEEEAAAFNWKVLSVSGNKYTMQTTGFGGEEKPLKVEVVVDGNTVKSVTVLEYAGETEYFGKDMIEGKMTSGGMGEFYNKYLTGEFAASDIDGVDTATGATMTTKGIVNAIRGAILVSKMDIEVNGDTKVITVVTEGFGGTEKPMKIKVTTNKATGTVEKVELLEYAGETEYYGKDMIEGKMASGAMADFYNQYIANSFAFEDIDGVDTATGATKTTKGIVSAIKQAIAATK